jgi:hypothetical protein
MKYYDPNIWIVLHFKQKYESLKDHFRKWKVKINHNFHIVQHKGKSFDSAGFCHGLCGSVHGSAMINLLRIFWTRWIISDFVSSHKSVDGMPYFPIKSKFTSANSGAVFHPKSIQRVLEIIPKILLCNKSFDWLFISRKYNLTYDFNYDFKFQHLKRNFKMTSHGIMDCRLS